MKKAFGAMLFALLVLGATAVSAQTTYTISWTNNGSSTCEAIPNPVTTTVTTKNPDGSTTTSKFTTGTQAGSDAFCPGYDPEYGWVGYSEATLGLPAGAFSTGAPYFNGDGMFMYGWETNMQQGSNPQFQNATCYSTATIKTRDGVWIGAETEWFKTSESCRYGRCITIYTPVGGTGSITATVS